MFNWSDIWASLFLVMIYNYNITNLASLTMISVGKDYPTFYFQYWSLTTLNIFILWHDNLWIKILIADSWLLFISFLVLFQTLKKKVYFQKWNLLFRIWVYLFLFLTFLYLQKFLILGNGAPLTSPSNFNYPEIVNAGNYELQSQCYGYFPYQNNMWCSYPPPIQNNEVWLMFCF